MLFISEIILSDERKGWNIQKNASYWKTKIRRREMQLKFS